MVYYNSNCISCSFSFGHQKFAGLLPLENLYAIDTSDTWLESQHSQQLFQINLAIDLS